MAVISDRDGSHKGFTADHGTRQFTPQEQYTQGCHLTVWVG
jgi:hypothetical protein